MKCLKMQQGPHKGQILRWTNKLAAGLVARGFGKYVPKSEWKRAGRSFAPGSPKTASTQSANATQRKQIRKEAA